jgi:serine/threonine protein kinase
MCVSCDPQPVIRLLDHDRFVQMALGLHYMHSNRILHRDLKTQNIFLLGNGRLVLGDLGISKVSHLSSP